MTTTTANHISAKTANNMNHFLNNTIDLSTSVLNIIDDKQFILVVHLFDACMHMCEVRVCVSNTRGPELDEGAVVEEVVVVCTVLESVLGSLGMEPHI